MSVIRRVRAWSPVPIIVLSARTAEEQKIAAFEAGADDYVTKPFSTPELLARVRAALRRGARGGEVGHVLEFGGVRVDLARRAAHGPGGDIHLTPLEYRVLETLARNAGFLGDTRSLRVCIKNLRGKLEPAPHRPQYLLTEPGLGYRLKSGEPEG